MDDTIDIGVVHRFQRAGSYLLASTCQAGMYCSYYKIQLGEQLVIEIQRAISKDINLRARQNCYAL